MKLNTFTRSRKHAKRLGRGHGSGRVKTSGRGTKGQKARTGKKLRAGFEGGQTPIFQRLPKYRGFRNPNRIAFQVVNVGDLEKLEEDTITRDVLIKNDLVRASEGPVKILGNGELTKALSIEVEKASASALEKITKAGGSFTSTGPVPVAEEAPKA